MKIDIDVPNGSSGKWSVTEFTIDEVASFRSALRDGGRSIPIGTYKSLSNEYGIMMSNTPAEIRDHHPFIKNAKGW